MGIFRIPLPVAPESMASLTACLRPPWDEPHFFSTNTLSKKFPSSPCLKVQGIMQYRPSGNKVLLLTSLRLIKVPVLSVWKIEIKFKILLKKPILIIFMGFFHLPMNGIENIAHLDF